MTKRLDGVAFILSEESVTDCLTIDFVSGVCTVMFCLRLDCGFIFGLWLGVDAKKRCGEGVCVGILGGAWILNMSWLYVFWRRTAGGT